MCTSTAYIVFHSSHVLHHACSERTACCYVNYYRSASGKEGQTMTKKLEIAAETASVDPPVVTVTLSTCINYMAVWH